MAIIRNLFAVIGLLAVIVVVLVMTTSKQEMARLDPQAPQVYAEMLEKLLETGNGAEATSWKVPVDEGLSADDVEETMKFVANEHNIANVGELPLYKDVEAKSGQPYRFVKIYMFCNSLTAARMLDYSDAFSAYLPCRITLVEDKQGKLWLYALNMDLMIYGGAPLPPALKEEALRVKEIILDIMHRGAKGAF